MKNPCYYNQNNHGGIKDNVFLLKYAQTGEKIREFEQMRPVFHHFPVTGNVKPTVTFVYLLLRLSSEWCKHLSLVQENIKITNNHEDFPSIQGNISTG